MRFIARAVSSASRAYSVGRSCGRSAMARPSRCRGTRCAPRTARPGRCSTRRSASIVPASALTYCSSSTASTRPRVPRLTASIGWHAQALAPLQEVVGADLVGLQAAPGEVQGGGAVIARADPVLPDVVGHEVAAGIAEQGDAELADQVGHVGAEARRVGLRVVGLVDAGVDAAAHVLHERAEEAGVDRADRKGGVGRDPGGHHTRGSSSMAALYVARVHQASVGRTRRFRPDASADRGRSLVRPGAPGVKDRLEGQLLGLEVREETGREIAESVDEQLAGARAVQARRVLLHLIACVAEAPDD